MRRCHVPEKPGYIDAVLAIWKCMGADSAHANAKALRKLWDILLLRKSGRMFSSVSDSASSLSARMLWS